MPRLFHSIAHGLNAMDFGEDGHSVWRRIADFIAVQPDLEITGTPLRSWVEWDSSMSVSSYASRLQGSGLWGGAIEMAACSRVFAVDIGVYEEDWYSSTFRRISDFPTLPEL